MIYCWLIVSVRALVGGRRQQEQCSQAAEAPRQPRAFAPRVAVVAEAAVSAKYQWYLWNILITLFEAVASATCKSAHQLFPPPCQSLHYFHTDLAAKNTSGGRCESIWQKKDTARVIAEKYGEDNIFADETGDKQQPKPEKVGFWGRIIRRPWKAFYLLNVNHNTSGSTWTFLEKKTIRSPNDSFSRTGPGPIDRNIWSPRKAFRRQPFTAQNPALLATICFHK